VSGGWIVAPSALQPISTIALSATSSGPLISDAVASPKELPPLAILDLAFANLELLPLQEIAFGAAASILPSGPASQMTSIADDRELLITPLAAPWSLAPENGLVHSLQSSSLTRTEPEGEELESQVLELTTLGRVAVFGGADKAG
jgi:hypothetical protein